LLTVDESGVGEDAKVMAHRWLGHADGGGEVTHAGFRGAREKAHDLETYGIGKDAERLRHAAGLMGGERRRPKRGATRVQLGDLLPHGDILTTVDAYVNVSTRIDTCVEASSKGGEAMRLDPCCPDCPECPPGCC
jgi:hypothetical protein